MKISARQYALSLLELSREKTGAALDESLRRFCLLLAKNNDLNKEKQILAELSLLLAKEEGELEVEIVSARKLEDKSLAEAENYLKDKTKAKKVVFKESLDPSLLGGVVLRYEGRVLDASLKNVLAELKNKISQ